MKEIRQQGCPQQEKTSLRQVDPSWCILLLILKIKVDKKIWTTEVLALQNLEIYS